MVNRGGQTRGDISTLKTPPGRPPDQQRASPVRYFGPGLCRRIGAPADSCGGLAVRGNANGLWVTPRVTRTRLLLPQVLPRQPESLGDHLLCSICFDGECLVSAEGREPSTP